MVSFFDPTCTRHSKSSFVFTFFIPFCFFSESSAASLLPLIYKCRVGRTRFLRHGGMISCTPIHSSSGNASMKYLPKSE